MDCSTILSVITVAATRLRCSSLHGAVDKHRSRWRSFVLSPLPSCAAWHRTAQRVCIVLVWYIARQSPPQRGNAIFFYRVMLCRRSPSGVNARAPNRRVLHGPRPLGSFPRLWSGGTTGATRQTRLLDKEAGNGSVAGAPCENLETFRQNKA